MPHFVDGVHYLTVQDLVSLNRNLIEIITPNEPIKVINQSGLESSQVRPSQIRYYEQTEDMSILSASLMHSLIQNHPFANANKRTAFGAGGIFLLLNGFRLSADTDESISISLRLAHRECTLEDLADWIKYRSVSIDSRQFSKKR